MKDFANILFSGPCNRHCPFCIGRQLPDAVNVNNLSLFPLTNLDAFISEINNQGIRQIVFTGTISDPQLYRHQKELLDMLRSSLTTDPVISIHTNGALTLRQSEIFNSYDKSAISFPSFDPETYARMMGRRPPDLAAIVRNSRIEVKVSCIVNRDNAHEVEDFLSRCRDIGITRVVLRRLFRDFSDLPILTGRNPVSHYRGNPVYNVQGMEVTVWNFNTTGSTSINLFPDGTIGRDYLLSDTVGFRSAEKAGMQS